ncbi:hypothetical protein [Candidatus Aalborgicola defluviihabitans]|nr:hypothetical protein [Burkholderiales bacterium]
MHFQLTIGLIGTSFFAKVGDGVTNVMGAPFDKTASFNQCAKRSIEYRC